MIAPSDIELDRFVEGCAAMLGLKLGNPARAAVREALNGLAFQAALVLDHPLQDEPYP